MFAFECKLSKDGSVKEKIAGILKRLGAVQLLLGVVLAIASFAAIDIDKSNMVVMEAYNKTISAKVLLGLDAGSAVSSIWVVVTGILPCYMMSGTDYNLLRSKVVYMVFSTIGASFFVPVIIASAIAGYTLRNSHVQLAVIMGILAAIEFLVAFLVSVYCCASPWWSGLVPCQIEKKRKDDLKDVFVANAKKEMGESPPEYQP